MSEPPDPVGPRAPGEAAALDDPLAQFTRYRDLLFTVAYEITGSVTDAEDVVQESYLRWSAARAGGPPVGNPRAYLAQIATRLALNLLRSRARAREDYIGPWLPEPVITAPDIAEDVVLAESVSMAMLLLIERLTPDERAVFVLREVFGFGYDEIAAAVGKTASAVRQIAHRARSDVQAHRPRYDADPADVAAVAHRFLTAVTTGNLQSLMDVLAPDVVLLSDGGGVAAAARRPIVTADNVARILIGLYEKFASTGRVEPAVVNGRLGVRFYIDGALDVVASADVVDGVVQTIYIVRNPEKLRRAGAMQTLAR